MYIYIYVEGTFMYRMTVLENIDLSQQDNDL